MIYALNGFDVHLVDLTGHGYSSGPRCVGIDIPDFMGDINLLLKMVNPNLPCFLYGHSMGGLSTASFLANNPKLNLAGAILSAPLMRFSKENDVDEVKKLIISLI